MREQKGINPKLNFLMEVSKPIYIVNRFPFESFTIDGRKRAQLFCAQEFFLSIHRSMFRDF